jgi:putative holliday junction resolvase
MKLMAIDYGEKRVGIASTDESGEFALPRMTLPNDENLLESIMKFKKEEGIEKIVMGESKNLKGESNSIMGAVNNLKKDLENLGVEVIFHPEIFTTVEARQIQGQTPLTDASAAALILKNYLDTMYNKRDVGSL